MRTLDQRFPFILRIILHSISPKTVLWLSLITLCGVVLSHSRGSAQAGRSLEGALDRPNISSGGVSNTVLGKNASIRVPSQLTSSSSWMSTGPDGGRVQTLAIDPVNPNTIYAGTDNGGVFKSTNGGNLWTKASIGLTGSLVSVRALAINPSNPSIIYAGIANPGGIFKSIDGSGSWHQVDGGIFSNFVDALAIDPNNSSTVYAGVRGDGVFKSTNGGESWTA